MRPRSSEPNPALRGWKLTEGVEMPTLWYRGMRRFLQVTCGAVWQIRVFNRRYEPTSGSAVYICNHQSFLDPVVMSMSLCRPMSYMARDSLFRIPIFGWAIASFNAFPVKRDTADTGAIKEAMRRLKRGGQVVVFAEGTRTHDGRIGPFLPGVVLLSQRSAEWTVPVVIDGAYEVWPRKNPLPCPGPIVVQYAPPIHRSEAAKMKPDDLVARVRQTLIEVQGELRRSVGRPAFTY
jgi:1-acyl-sn-glycerol-3-phosphate acyltransferase